MFYILPDFNFCLSNPMGSLKDLLMFCFLAVVFFSGFPASIIPPRLNKCHGRKPAVCKRLGFPQGLSLHSRIFSFQILMPWLPKQLFHDLKQLFFYIVFFHDLKQLFFYIVFSFLVFCGSISRQKANITVGELNYQK